MKSKRNKENTQDTSCKISYWHSERKIKESKKKYQKKKERRKKIDKEKKKQRKNKRNNENT